MKQVRINRAKWRTGGPWYALNDFGDTYLLNKEGYKCCLGFACQQCFPALKNEDIIGEGTPAEIDRLNFNKTKFPNSKLFFREDGLEKDWIDEAIRVNDDCHKPLSHRERELIGIFADGGLELEFFGNYTKKQLKAFAKTGIKP